MAKTGSTIEVVISANTKKYDSETRRLVRDAQNLQKSLALEFDGKRYAEAQRLMSEAIERTDKKAASLKEQLQKLESEGKIDSKEYQDLNSAMIKAEAQSVQLKQQLQELNQVKIDNLVNGFKNAGQAITSAGQALVPFSAAATAVIASLGAIGASAVSAGDEIGTTAQQLNISSEALQRWLYIADQTDVEATQFVNAAQRIQNALSHLSSGEADTTATALEELGFTAEDAAKGMSENFEPIITALSNVKDETRQSYLAFELFGTRMAGKIIPLLNDGGAGLQELASQFDELGFLSEETVNDLDAFEDVMDRIKYQFTLVKNEIGASFLPLMEAMANTIETKVVPVFQRMRDFFQSLTLDQQKLILGILAFTAALAPMLLIIGKMTSGVGSLIGTVSKLSASFSNVGLSLGPLAAIAAVFALLYTTNENFRNSINDLVTTLGEALMPILNVVGELFNTVLKAVMPLVDILGNVLSVYIQQLVTTLQPFIQVLTNVLVPVLNVVLSVFQSLLGFILGPISKGFKFFSDTFTGVFKGIQNFISGVMDFVGKAINKAIDFINLFIQSINKIGKHLGFTVSEIDHVKLQLETGRVPQASVAVNMSQDVPVNQAINNNTTTQQINNNSTTNVDNSTRDVTINVTVENYGSEIDIDDMIEQINKGLLEAY